MKGIPKHLNTKQDLLNVCADLHHARARILLKGLDPEALSGLGVTAADLKRIKAGLAQRKRTETLAARKREKIERHRQATEIKIRHLGNEWAGLKATLRAAREAAAAIPRHEAAIAELEKTLKKLKAEMATAPAM